MVDPNQDQWEQPGSTMQPLYTKRCQVMYVIPENELNQISHLNTLSTIFFSVGSGLITFGIGIWVDAAFQPEPLSAIAKALMYVASPIMGVLGLLCYAGGVWQICTRRSMLATIKKESTQQEEE